MVDTMRDNGSSVEIRRKEAMVLICSGCLTRAEDAITSVINGMHRRRAFSTETCNFLWALSALNGR
jgi:hypothetical protein